MWGTISFKPFSRNANLKIRKEGNNSQYVMINGTEVEVYFSVGDNALGRMSELVKNSADHQVFFSIFAWSDQTLLNELKFKWEGSYQKDIGTLTGFTIKGLFDPSFWNQWWSASIEMTSRTTYRESTNNPNIRWAHSAPVYQAREERKLHSKTMLIDPETDSDPIVIVGSTNWSNNANNVNDENMLIIHNKKIVNQFVQEFYARYAQAGGKTP